MSLDHRSGCRIAVRRATMNTEVECFPRSAPPVVLFAGMTNTCKDSHLSRFVMKIQNKAQYPNRKHQTLSGVSLLEKL